MAQARPNWLGYAVVAVLAFAVGRGCTDDPALDTLILPVGGPVMSADDIAVEAAAAAGEAAAAVDASRQIRPIYSAPSARPYAAPSYPSFANCSEARVAGAAPVFEGDPGYGSHLDRDGDGVGCE